MVRLTLEFKGHQHVIIDAQLFNHKETLASSANNQWDNLLNMSTN